MSPASNVHAAVLAEVYAILRKAAGRAAEKCEEPAGNRLDAATEVRGADTRSPN
jgi:hypothetical protein